MFRLCRVLGNTTTAAQIASQRGPKFLFGIVTRWNHQNGVGYIRQEGTTNDFYVSRAGLDNGFYLTEQQRVLFEPSRITTRRPFALHVRTENGEYIRPRELRGVITSVDPETTQAVIVEKDLSGAHHLAGDAPTFSLNVEDYECLKPAPSVGMEVKFCAEDRSSTAKRVVLDFESVPARESSGVVRELHAHHGFLTEDGTLKSIFFSRKGQGAASEENPEEYNNETSNEDGGESRNGSSTATTAVEVGDRVKFMVRLEPPTSRAAGKPLAYALQKY